MLVMVGLVLVGWVVSALFNVVACLVMSGLLYSSVLVSRNGARLTGTSASSSAARWSSAVVKHAVLVLSSSFLGYMVGIMLVMVELELDLFGIMRGLWGLRGVLYGDWMLWRGG